MNYPRLLNSLRQHPGNRDNRQRRIALLVLRVARKLRSQGLDANRPVLKA